MFVKVVVFEFRKHKVGKSGWIICRYSQSPSSSFLERISWGKKSRLGLKPVPKRITSAGSSSPVSSTTDLGFTVLMLPFFALISPDFIRGKKSGCGRHPWPPQKSEMKSFSGVRSTSIFVISNCQAKILATSHQKTSNNHGMPWTVLSITPRLGYAGFKHPDPNRLNVAYSKGTKPKILRGTGQCVSRKRRVDLSATFADSCAQSNADFPKPTLITCLPLQQFKSLKS